MPLISSFGVMSKITSFIIRVLVENFDFKRLEVLDFLFVGILESLLLSGL